MKLRSQSLQVSPRHVEESELPELGGHGDAQANPSPSDQTRAEAPSSAERRRLTRPVTHCKIVVASCSFTDSSRSPRWWRQRRRGYQRKVLSGGSESAPTGEESLT